MLAALVVSGAGRRGRWLRSRSRKSVRLRAEKRWRRRRRRCRGCVAGRRGARYAHCDMSAANDGQAEARVEPTRRERVYKVLDTIMAAIIRVLPI